MIDKATVERALAIRYAPNLPITRAASIEELIRLNLEALRERAHEAMLLDMSENAARDYRSIRVLQALQEAKIKKPRASKA